MGGDAEQETWAAPAEERFQAPEEAPAAPASAPDSGTAGAGAAAGPDTAAVCDDLFAPELLSLEAGKRFEERYQGELVRWSGRIRRADAFAFDLVLGDRPGTKLIVELREGGGAFRSRTVQAVMALPPEALRDLQARAGERVVFEGRLIGCDAFSRKLFVADARLV